MTYQYKTNDTTMILGYLNTYEYDIKPYLEQFKIKQKRIIGNIFNDLTIQQRLSTTLFKEVPEERVIHLRKLQLHLLGYIKQAIVKQSPSFATYTNRDFFLKTLKSYRGDYFNSDITTLTKLNIAAQKTPQDAYDIYLKAYTKSVFMTDVIRDFTADIFRNIGNGNELNLPELIEKLNKK